MNFNGISELVRNVVDERNLSSLIREQEIALATTPCADKKIGRWVDDFGLPALQGIFSLTDEEFETEFPTLCLDGTDRRYLQGQIAGHTRSCPHCKMKVEYDEKLEAAMHTEALEQEPKGAFFEVGQAA